MGLFARMAGLALRRPQVVRHLLGATWAFRARGWYRRPPFLPLPTRAYLLWRMETAYGDPEAVPSADEIERFLRWGTRMRGLM
jgi:type II secretory pathway predicted ATPase ExeA